MEFYEIMNGMGKKQLSRDILEANKELEELKLLEELQASEELYTPFYWIEESEGYGRLTKEAEKVVLKHLKPKDEVELLFKKDEVRWLFRGWGMLIY